MGSFTREVGAEPLAPSMGTPGQPPHLAPLGWQCGGPRPLPGAAVLQCDMWRVKLQVSLLALKWGLRGLAPGRPTKEPAGSWPVASATRGSIRGPRGGAARRPTSPAAPPARTPDEEVVTAPVQHSPVHRKLCVPTAHHWLPQEGAKRGAGFKWRSRLISATPGRRGRGGTLRREGAGVPGCRSEGRGARSRVHAGRRRRGREGRGRSRKAQRGSGPLLVKQKGRSDPTAGRFLGAPGTPQGGTDPPQTPPTI